MTAADWIQTLGLQPHPEGGWYRETYRAATVIAAAHLPAGFAGPRAVATAIYFLLTGDQVSALHRLRADELWHFYDGSPLSLARLAPDGQLTVARLGRDVAAGESLQTLVPAGTWFGAWLDDPQGWTLAGCTVAPGFDFADFELGGRAELVARHPHHRALIERLTR